MSKARPEFRIGQWVRVSHTCRFEYDNSERSLTTARRLPGAKRIMVRDENEIEGQIVGIVYRKIGKYEPGYSGGRGLAGDWIDCEPPSLVVTGTIKLWKVIQSYTSKPVEAQIEDITPLDTDRPLPFRPPVQMDEGTRKWMSDESKTWPRDEKGRWVSVR